MVFLRIFIMGMCISFLGTLPFGTLNITAVQIAVAEGVRSAIYFAIGALLVEIVYVRLSLVAIDWVKKRKKLFLFLEWLSLIVIVILAIANFAAALKPTTNNNYILLNSSLPSFILGISLSAINPVQIPFWFGWSTVLLSKNVLRPKPIYYYTYILGIGIGTFLGNMIFIFGGPLLIEKLSANNHILNWVIGGIFLLTALIQFWRLMYKKKKKLD